ncbi:MAG: AAA family ATPase [Candidatus Thiodiazotropha sp.]
MTVILSCSNLKGGVGKTALAVQFSAYCGLNGKKTLLIDLDPQTNATLSCVDIEEWSKWAKDKGTVADLLGARAHTSAEGKKKSINDIIWPNVFKNVDLLPSHLDLFTIDLDLAATTAREFKLRKAITPIKDNYDVIVCDCPPNLTIPTQNALAASTHFVVPISLDYLSGLGVGLLLNRVIELCGDLEHDIVNSGLVISRVGRPAQHREETETALRETFGDSVLDQFLTERVAVSEAAAAHKSIFEMTDTKAKDEFSAVSTELCRRLGLNSENT